MNWYHISRLIWSIQNRVFNRDILKKRYFKILFNDQVNNNKAGVLPIEETILPSAFVTEVLSLK
jgi:hypothetical protein